MEPSSGLRPLSRGKAAAPTEANKKSVADIDPSIDPMSVGSRSPPAGKSSGKYAAAAGDTTDLEPVQPFCNRCPVDGPVEATSPTAISPDAGPQPKRPSMVVEEDLD